MTKRRKTIKVAAIVESINEYLLNSLDNKTAARDAMGMFLESVLMETGNYNGFRYLDEKDMKLSFEGTTVGIRHGSKDDGTYCADFEGTDRTRVQYAYNEEN